MSHTVPGLLTKGGSVVFALSCAPVVFHAYSSLDPAEVWMYVCVYVFMCVYVDM